MLYIRNDYFAIDFTMEELKTLRLNQRYGERDPSHDGQYQIVSLDEYIDIAQEASRTIGIYPETKDPEWTNSEPVLKDANVTFEELLSNKLAERGYVEPDGRCYIQSFGRDSLERLQHLTDLPLIKLSAFNMDDEELDEFSEFCHGIGISRSVVVKVGTRSNQITEITDFIDRAHAKNLVVHTYTLRNEHQNLAWDYGQDPYEEYRLFTELGVDGIFTDFPGTMSRFLQWHGCA